MRLLDTYTGQFVEKDPDREASDWDSNFKYAILSHTWNTKDGEQTYQELQKIQERYKKRTSPEQSTVPQQLIDIIRQLDARISVLEGASSHHIFHSTCICI